MQTPVLDGVQVRLEPLEERHLKPLEAIAFVPSNWKYMVAPVRNAEDLQRWAVQAWAHEQGGTWMQWVTVSKEKGAETLAGATRFMDLDMQNRTVEIGNTWIAEAFRGTRANTETKFLQLRYAFETLEMERVAFKTHAANLRSQAAIKAIGASYEGTFRSHLLMSDGTRRDTAWFSIIKKEWPDVKELLERRLRQPPVS